MLLPIGVLSATLNGTSSIYTFVVSGCVVDTAIVGCNETSVEFSCSITNHQFIDFAEFRIGGVLYNASNIASTFSVDYVKPLSNSTINTSIVLDRIYITDTNSDTAIFTDNVSFRHDCLTCSDVGVADSCSVFDNTTFRHVFEPTGCDVDFNESVVCNYCSEDLQQYLGECLVNNTQSVQYVDLNYFSCCVATGISSDCSIEVYPYNETTIGSCSFLTEDFVCNIPSVVEFDDKMTFSCLLPDNDDYSCVVKVFESGRLVQINPEQTIYGNGLISFKKEESKEFFTPVNKVLNAYFTKKNLITDKDFVVEVECSNGEDVYVSQQLVEPFYKDASSVLARGVWFKDNAAYMFIGLFFALIIAGIIGYAWVSIKGGRK